MLLGLTYQLVLSVVDLLLVRTRSDGQLRAEVLALRHQLRVLKRKVGKPPWQPGGWSPPEDPNHPGRGTSTSMGLTEVAHFYRFAAGRP